MLSVFQIRPEGLHYNDGRPAEAVRYDLKYRRFPDDVFVGSERLLGALRRRMARE